MSDASGTAAWTYDPRGRTLVESRTISGTLYQTDFSYDASDRVRTTTYPASTTGSREVVTTTYTSGRGLPNGLSGTLPGVFANRSYVNSTTYNALGQVAQQSLGNGLSEYDNHFGLETLTWGNTFYGKLRQLCVKTTSAGACSESDGTGTAALNLLYWYDSVGNVSGIGDRTNSWQEQDFAYDALNRIISATTAYGGNGQYSESYAYDPLGNFTNKSDLGNYTYGDAAHIHAVTAAGSNTYTYDANGNMLTRIKPTTPVTYNQAWYVDNLVEAVVMQDVLTDYFVYDGDGKRARKTEYTNLTATVTDTFDSLNNSL
jgi:hypothetical protein